MLENLRAKDIMIRKVLTINPNDPLAKALITMTRKNIGALPVVDNDMLVGIITHRDVMLFALENLDMKVKDIMTKNVVCVEENTPLKEIVKIMAEKGYQRLPVVRNRKLVGLVTQSSIIYALNNILNNYRGDDKK